MASQQQTTAFFPLLVIFSLVLVQLTFTCSPPEGGYVEEPLSEKVFHSDIVLYGKVLRTYPDERFNYGGGSTVYTAEMEIYCSLKGGPVPLITNVTEAGFIPGYCISVDLEVGKQYVVLVRKDSETGVLTPYTSQIEADLQMLDEVTIVCDMVLHYPIGVSPRNRKVTCPEIAAPGDCVRHEVHTPEPDVGPPSPPPFMTNAPLPPKIEDLTTAEPAMEVNPQPDEEEKKPDFEAKPQPEEDPDVAKEPAKSQPSTEKKTGPNSGVSSLLASSSFVALLMCLIMLL